MRPDLTRFAYCPLASRYIETRDDAVSYYAHRLARAHPITCYGKRVTIVFEHDATHVYSEGLDDGEDVLEHERIERLIPLGRGRTRLEVRRFSLERARLMDEILRSISCFVVSVPESGGPPGRGKRVLYGPVLADGRSVCVVLRPGPGTAFTCVSAYPVLAHRVIAARRLPRAKFPP